MVCELSLDKAVFKRDLGLPQGFLGGSDVKNLSAMMETLVLSLGQEDPLEKGRATHCCILAWRIPWTDHGVVKSRT